MTITKKIKGGHSEHDHQFELQNYKKPFTCDGCREQGFGPRYRCNICDYNLHKECKSPKSKITHHFFKGSEFKFFKEVPKTECKHRRCGEEHCRVCDACGMGIYGFVYHCPENGYDLHPFCSNLKDKRCSDGMVLKLGTEGLSKSCEWCKKKKLFDSKAKVQGWSYTSRCKNYHIHVFCATEMMHDLWKKGLIDDVSSGALEITDLRLMRKDMNGGTKGSVVWTTMKIFLKIILGIFVGDPTMILPSIFVELIAK